VEKGFNLAAAGAAGYVLANQESEGSSIVADDHYLPAIHVTHADGVALKAWLGAGGPAFTGEIGDAAPGADPAVGDVMSDFSSRGPHPSAPQVIKPDLSAPGSEILAAVASGSGGDEVEFYSGTSMSSPHVAGAAALVRAVKPGWSPAQIKSALMLTAKSVVRKEDGVSPGDPFDQGAGRVHVGDAVRALLVMEETGTDFALANPSLGGDPTGLNLASLADPACDGSCSWFRSFRNASAGVVEFAVTQSAGGPDLVLTSSPATFALGPGGSEVVAFTAFVGACPAGGCGPGADWMFGEVELQALSSPLGSGGGLDLHMPVAIVPLPEPDPLLGLGSGVAGLLALARLNPRRGR
jgi:subtilisin family serine protease